MERLRQTLVLVARLEQDRKRGAAGVGAVPGRGLRGWTAEMGLMAAGVVAVGGAPRASCPSLCCPPRLHSRVIACKCRR